MTDRPIIFSAPMVRALLDGRKTQTRRIIKLCGRRPEFCGGRGDLEDPTCWGWEDGEHGDWVTLEKDTGQRMGWRDWCGAYAPGARLYVREAFQAHSWATDCVTIRYRAEEKTAGFTAQVEQIPYPDGDKNRLKYVEPQGPYKWRPSIHMPRWASRLTLAVTDVRVQRLQEISEADAWAEGCAPGDLDDNGKPFPAEERHPSGKGWVDWDNARDWFADLWNSLHGPDAWDANPWVVALTFDVRRGNIDAEGTA